MSATMPPLAAMMTAMLSRALPAALWPTCADAPACARAANPPRAPAPALSPPTNPGPAVGGRRAAARPTPGERPRLRQGRAPARAAARGHLRGQEPGAGGGHQPAGLWPDHV